MHDHPLAFEDDLIVGGIIVGGINVHEVDQANGTFSYGVGVGPEHKGNGYAAEAVLLVLRFMFDGLTAEEFHQLYPKLKPTL